MKKKTYTEPAVECLYLLNTDILTASEKEENTEFDD